LVVVARTEYTKAGLDGILGCNKSVATVAKSSYPYDNFKVLYEDSKTRIDGPCVFRVEDKMFVLGRRQKHTGNLLLKRGSILAKKSTALYEIKEDRLEFITDMKSAGDTSYGSAIVEEDNVKLCYYTSSIHHDFIWIIGMIEQTEVYTAQISKKNF
jgi:hypothetical protein